MVLIKIKKKSDVATRISGYYKTSNPWPLNLQVDTFSFHTFKRMARLIFIRARDKQFPANEHLYNKSQKFSSATFQLNFNPSPGVDLEEFFFWFKVKKTTNVVHASSTIYL